MRFRSGLKSGHITIAYRHWGVKERTAVANAPGSRRSIARRQCTNKGEPGALATGALHQTAHFPSSDQPVPANRFRHDLLPHHPAISPLSVLGNPP
jgi:hypothetical protein